ncbi:MAG: hypothetical protein C0508_00745 [Cyanobacteria bacterium PR.023]|nr:hypothetical protein [Cyanobacteria bacterium PR.023]
MSLIFLLLYLVAVRTRHPSDEPIGLLNPDSNNISSKICQANYQKLNGQICSKWQIRLSNKSQKRVAKRPIIKHLSREYSKDILRDRISISTDAYRD